MKFLQEGWGEGHSKISRAATGGTQHVLIYSGNDCANYRKVEKGELESTFPSWEISEKPGKSYVKDQQEGERGREESIK